MQQCFVAHQMWNISMKSFRFVLGGEPLLPRPSRNRNDFTASEVANLQAQFKMACRRYRRRATAGLAAMAASGGGGIALGVSTVHWEIAGALWFIGIVAFVLSVLRLPTCPACGREVDGCCGEYCPRCGAHAVALAGLLSQPICRACGLVIRFGKGRGYPIRYCSVCGIMLDEKGF